MIEKVFRFLKDNPTFYVATLDGDKPRVRPFGLVVRHEGRLYFETSDQKDVYRQLRTNSNVEISTTSADHRWIRLRGKAVFEENMAVKRQAFADLPMLAGIYQTPENPAFVVFYLADAEATICGMTGESETATF